MYIISFNHKNSDVILRSKLANIKIDEFKEFKEVLLLLTCNRFEVIFNKVYDRELLFKEVFSKFITFEEYNKAFFFENDEAIRHIFQVASSLDSLVVGETQITGQLKDAFLLAYNKGFVGKDISRVIHFSFKCAKKIRNLTDISKEPVSIATIAIKFAKNRLGSLSGYSAVVVGAGEMSSLISKNLVKEGVNIVLVNRDLDRALALKEELGDEVNIDVHSLDKLPKLINNYRLLFSSTSAPNPIILSRDIQQKSFKRLWFDLAIPKDIEDINFPNIEIVRIDDLKYIAKENLFKRIKNIDYANRVIDDCVKEFKDYLKSVEIEPVIKNINQIANNIIDQSLSNAIKKGFIPPELEDNVRKLMETSFKKFLHNPIKNLKNLSNSPEIDLIVLNMKRVFNLEDVKVDPNKCDYYLKENK